MKELSIEEKARRYDEALERAKSFELPEYKNIMASVFPELAESEDEKIRKELIEQVVYIVPNDNEVDSEGKVLPIYQKRIEKYLVWLEKQGEQKQIIIPKFRAGDTIRIKGSYAEYKITDIHDGFYYGKGWCIEIGGEDDYELVEQKPSDEELKELLRAEYEKGRAKGKVQALGELPKEIDDKIWQIANNACITWEHSFAVLTAAKNAYEKGKADGITLVKEIFTEDILYRFVLNSIDLDGEIDDKSELREYFLDLLNEEIEQKNNK